MSSHSSLFKLGSPQWPHESNVTIPILKRLVFMKFCEVYDMEKCFLEQTPPAIIQIGLLLYSPVFREDRSE